MKYKVIKEFDSLKKGDVLENVEDPEIYSFEEETENTYKYVSYSEDIIKDLENKGYLLLVEENTDEDSCTYCQELEDKICSVVDEIDNLLKQYQKDNEEVNEKFANDELPYCAKVEADTVHTNLTKVLNHIKELLLNE